MALTFPRDMVSDRCWSEVTFDLMFRQELSRSNAGTQARDLGPALWTASFETYSLPMTEARAIMADFLTLRGSVNPFFAVPMFGQRPAASDGTGLGSATVNAIRADRGALRIDGLPEGLALTAGDFVSVLTSVGGRELLQLATGGVVSATGLSPWLEVNPFIRPSVTVGDFAKLNLPFVEMRLDPGTLEMPRHSLRRWRVRFQATQVIR